MELLKWKGLQKKLQEQQQQSRHLPCLQELFACLHTLFPNIKNTQEFNTEKLMIIMRTTNLSYFANPQWTRLYCWFLIAAKSGLVACI